MTQVIAESLSHQQGGHMRSAVERIAAFAAAARPEHLTNAVANSNCRRRSLKTNPRLRCKSLEFSLGEHEFSKIPTIQQKSAQVRFQCGV